MDYIFFWLTTIILSTGTSLANELRMYKDAADNGYRIDGINLNRNMKKYFSPIVRNLSLKLLIPFYNIFVSLINVMAYNLNRPKLLDNLNMLDALDEMSEEEKEKFQKFPTGLHAFILMIKNTIKLSKLNKIEIIDKAGISEIYFDILDDNDIEIVKVYGPLSKATKETQKEKAMQTLYGVALAGLKEYGTDEEFIKAINENGSKELSLELEKLKKIEEQKTELEQLKEELLNQTEKSEEIDKPKTKKRKNKKTKSPQ